MRNALGLMLGCLAAAVIIAGVFFFVLSPRADLAAPQTVAARLADPLLAQRPCALPGCETDLDDGIPRSSPVDASDG